MDIAKHFGSHSIELVRFNFKDSQGELYAAIDRDMRRFDYTNIDEFKNYHVIAFWNTEEERDDTIELVRNVKDILNYWYDIGGSWMNWEDYLDRIKSKELYYEHTDH